MNYKIIFILLFFTVAFYAQQDDPYLSVQWNLTKIQAQDAWNISTGSPNIIIAVLDDGVDANHPDLQNKLVTGYDVEDNDNTTNPDGDFYHGTAVAGIAAAATKNGIGIAGVGYNCNIMPIQLAHEDRNLSNPANFVIGIRWAADHGADIICFSGNTDVSDDVYAAIDYATTYGRNGKGCVFIKSAGNSGSAGISFPGQHPKALSVGATDQYDLRRSDSSYGPELDVMAPNVIYATDISGSAGRNKTGDYISDFERTSAAAPQVAGLAGLILSYNNQLTEYAVRSIICYTADDINTPGFDNETGWGRINAWRALDAISHVTTTGALTRSEVWVGTVTLTGTVTVPTGCTLAILSSATINLNSYSVVSTGGTIINNGTVTGLRATFEANGITKGYCGRIQAAANYAGNEHQIHLQNGNFNENISIYNKTGLAIYGNPNYNPFGSLTITNCPGFDGFGFGVKNVYVSDCNLFCLHGFTASGTNQTNTGFTLFNSSTYDWISITADYLTLGIFCSDGTTANIPDATISGSLAGLQSINGSNVTTTNSSF